MRTITRETKNLTPGTRVLTTEGRTTRVRTIEQPTGEVGLYTLTFTNGTSEMHMWDACWSVVLTNAQFDEHVRAEYAEELRSTLRPHQMIYTTGERTNPRSPNVHVRMFTAEQNEDKSPYIRDITLLAARATGNALSDLRGIVYGGYGYSKEFQAVYGLGRALFPKGYQCTGDGCRSNDHTNGTPRDGKTHHRDGGYYFTQSSL